MKLYESEYILETITWKITHALHMCEPVDWNKAYNKDNTENLEEHTVIWKNKKMPSLEPAISDNYNW